MKTIYKLSAVLLCFALLCGCGNTQKAKPKLSQYKTSFKFDDKYTEVTITSGDASIGTTNLYENKAYGIYTKLATEKFVPMQNIKTENKDFISIIFENSGVSSPQKNSAEFILYNNNTVKFKENGKTRFFSTDKSVYKSIKGAFSELSLLAGNFCKTENGEYKLTGTNGKGASLVKDKNISNTILYKFGVIKINNGEAVYYFDCAQGKLSAAMPYVSDYFGGNIASQNGNEIHLTSISDSRFNYTINTFEKPILSKKDSLLFVNFFDEKTLEIAYDTADGIYSQKVDLSPYFKDFNDKFAVKNNNVTQKKTQQNKLPSNYTYNPPTPSTSAIPPFTAELNAHLMQYKNDRAGYGWKGAENRQNYYSNYNAYATGDRSKKIVYLTFDEGYEYNENTNKILDILAAENVKAVFFVTLSFAKSRPDLVGRMITEGHIVGNHSASHANFVSISSEKGYNEVKTLHDYIQTTFGYTMSLFRFPEGVASDRALELVKQMGYTSVFWNCAYADWDTANQPTPATTRTLIANNTQNGTIYLFHAVSNTNVAMLSEIIHTVRGMGYEFALFGK